MTADDAARRDQSGLCDTGTEKTAAHTTGVNEKVKPSIEGPKSMTT